MHIRTSGASIHVEVGGQGELALVFLHYYGGSYRTWDRVAGVLSSRFRIVTYDHRGWGESSAPQEGYAVADLADDAQEVIRALKLDRFVLVGHSMGGKVAQLLASRNPTGLEGVVLVAPAPPSPMDMTWEDRKQIARVYDTRESISAALDNVLTAKRLPDDLREQVIADSLRGAPQAKSAWPMIVMSEDIVSEVAKISVPVLVLAGELDQVDRVDSLQRDVVARIPGTRLHVLLGTGHLSPLEVPLAVAQNIQEFVSGLNHQQPNL